LAGFGRCGRKKSLSFQWVKSSPAGIFTTFIRPFEEIQYLAGEKIWNSVFSHWSTRFLRHIVFFDK
jgi:hypothetical protein